MERAAQVVQRLKGPVVPINLCFTPDHEIDCSAVRRYVNWLCNQRAPVLMLTYGSSEYVWLSDDDIYRLTAELAEEIAGRALFITSTGLWTPKVCGEFLLHADRVGADAVKVQINPWGIQSNRERFIGYFDRIQDVASIPLLLWCNGGGAGAVPVDVVAELARRPQIVGMKNDEDQFYYYYDCIRATIDEDFAVISGGQMRNFAFGYQVGSPAYLCPIAPFRPDIALAFYSLLAERRYDDAWQMVFRYEDPWLRKAVEMDWLFSIKAALCLYGLYPDHCTSPFQSRNAGKVEQIRQCLERIFGTIEKATL
jgi:4-hydroxy-tetrahydrodipicolinate synthase